MAADRATPEQSERLHRLLAHSLIAWRLVGRAELAGENVVRINALGRIVEVEPAAAGLPFRWMVTIDGRKRPALSVVAVLRQVRAALDPKHKPARLRA